jgi:exopolysaccharide biosynthesis polyprenyl glycosylphosphotransferase
LYDSRRLSTWFRDFIDIVKATTAGTLVIVVFALVFNIRLVTPTFLAVFFACSVVVTTLSRVFLRHALRRVRLHGRNLRNVIIVGTNPRAIRFAKNIEARPYLGYRILGFADDSWGHLQAFRKTGYPLVADLKQLPEYIRTQVVDEVFVCLPLKTYYGEAAQIVDLCETQGIIIRFLSDLFNQRIAHSKVARFQDNYMITFHTGSMGGWPIFLKRAMDFLGSLLLILVFSPLFLLLAVLAKVFSPGPVFFQQERLGINKRRFRVYKFRTMVPDAEKRQADLEHLNEMDGAAFKIKDDPRVTPIGRFLRKTSLDELPQLFNVLKGDMSLVGPRPLPVRDYEGFDQDWHRRRFSVRPGITCLWQVSGRSDVTFDQWMKLDIQYIDQWSLWLDLKILAKTIPAVLKGTGAA